MTQVIRRNNPYASSFDGSLSASLDKSQQMTYDPSYHLNRLTAQRPALGSMISEYRCDAPPGDFDVHSESGGSDEAHDSPYGFSPAQSSEPSSTGNYGCSRSCCAHFEAAEMTAFLESMGTPVDAPCAAGNIVTVYNGDISQHFNIPSDQIQITRGSIKYAEHHARYGQQTRFRFQLCHNYLQRKCTKLSECSYIHATVLPKPSEVHLNPFAPRRLAADRHGHGHDVPLSAQDDPSVAEAYDTLPPGMTFKVYAPNDNGTTTPQMIASDMIIVTAGAVSARRGVDTHCRHCAHYQFKRLCHLGSRCHFIHSKVPFSGHTAFHTAPPTSQR